MTASRSSDANVTRRLLVMLAVILLPGGSLAGESDEAAQLAVKAVVEQIKVDPSSIRVQATERIEWTDSSHRCSTGATNSTLQTPGYRVLLRAAERLYVVHVGGDKAVICGGGLAVASAVQETPTMQSNAEPEPSDPPSRVLISKARADLARRLAVAPDEIVFVKFKPVIWPDGGLGCPRPGMVYTQVQQDGVLIRFEVRGQHYDYHSGAGRDPFLCENPADSRPDRPEK